MLDKAHRLTTAEFAKVFHFGNTKHTPLLQGKFLDTQASAKCVVVVGKKVSKSAVARNRLRRQLYALVRELGYVETMPYRHTIIVAKPSLRELDFPAQKKALKELLQL